MASLPRVNTAKTKAARSPRRPRVTICFLEIGIFGDINYNGFCKRYVFVIYLGWVGGGNIQLLDLLDYYFTK